MVIVILGIAMLPLLITYANVITRGMKRETISIATGLATELMEEIESKRYDENESSPWTATLGPETGETDRSNFDDVDDFEGWSENPIPGYSSSVDIYYVEPGKWDTEVQGPTDFKQIIVTISHSQAGNVRLVSVKQGY